jgi:phosphoadenosine phosphosulfate reductase
VAPLTKSLKGNSYGLVRAEQSENRSDLSLFEYDEKFEIIKFNPLLKWTLKEVEYYLENNVPQNTLHKQDLWYWLCAMY